ncbi:hypothetical protein DY000_02013231 [Brassica cretica]|uniref:Uncharacterized protein n=1 Tax=Brassica cretica TaxID=69181 RepID=A0ABQ7CKS3_BRACR|nr:hypothetical protein DY000_02013231 [Brassica cretica]
MAPLRSSSDVQPPPSEEARAALTVSMVKAPPQPRSRPPPDPPPCKLSVQVETLTPSEPPEPPDPPDAVFTLFFLPFINESLYTSPRMVTKVVDQESSVSDMEDETTSGVFLGVSKRRVLSRVVRSPDSGVLNPSLPSNDAADPSSPSFRLVKTGSGPCSVFKNQLLRVFTGCSLLYIGRSKPNTSGSPTYWLRRETNDCRLRFVLSRSVWLQPYHVCGSYLSLTSAFTTQRINFAALSFAISVLQEVRRDKRRQGDAEDEQACSSIKRCQHKVRVMDLDQTGFVNHIGGVFRYFIVDVVNPGSTPDVARCGRELVLLTTLGKDSPLAFVFLHLLFLSRMAPRFVYFILSPFISLFSHLVVPFIVDHVVYGLKLKLWFLGGWLPFSPTQSFVILRWHECLVSACLVCEVLLIS